MAQFAVLIGLIFFDTTVVSGGDGAAAAALILVEVVLILAGYPILFEWLTRGRTLGKLAMGLRVVRDDGGPIGFRHALVRGLSGFLLEKPGLFAPLGTAGGVLTIIFNPGSKRIGDLMAGTFVVNERAGPRTALVAPTFGVPIPLQGWAAGLDLTGLDDQLALSVRQFVLRASAFTPAARYELGEQLRGRLAAVVAPPLPPDLPTPVLLMTVLAERRRRAEQSYHSAAYAQNPFPQNPYVAGPYVQPVPTQTAGPGFAPPR